MSQTRIALPNPSYRSAARRVVMEFQMGDLINLRRARKRRDKQIAGQHAEENRAKFGRSKSEREIETAKTLRASRALDQHKLTPGDEP